jgi:hypothetical protein
LVARAQSIARPSGFPIRAGSGVGIHRYRRPFAPGRRPLRSRPASTRSIRSSLALAFQRWRCCDGSRTCGATSSSSTTRGTNPFQHWDEAGRHPPDDIASNYMPALGPYDSRAVAVMEQHARWIAETGIGAINVSWWGPGSGSDRIVPLLMDVMRAHDIHVTFHLEPYADDRSPRYGRDILYLLENYGVRRRWDAFLLPRCRVLGARLHARRRLAAGN